MYLVCSFDFKIATNPPCAAQDLQRDVALLPFSSGTTGPPKGVQLSQANLVANNLSIGANDPEYMYRAFAQFQEVTISVLPMFHIFGLNVTLTGGLHMGAKQVVVPSFQPAQFARLLAEHRPTFLHLVPPLAAWLAASPLVEPAHLADLRQINVGAAPSGPALIQQFYKKAPHYVRRMIAPLLACHLVLAGDVQGGLGHHRGGGRGHRHLQGARRH